MKNMAYVEPVTLVARGIALVPLALSHENGLRDAAADGGVSEHLLARSARIQRFLLFGFKTETINLWILGPPGQG